MPATDVMFDRIFQFSTQLPWLIMAVALLVGSLGYRAMLNTPVDAIPDISENQVIVYAQWPGQSPQDVENQVTRPLSGAMRGVPRVREVRALSGFGFSQVYVVFEDGVDFYWARARVDEKLKTLGSELPADVVPGLGPDATALGQIFWYSVQGDGYDLGTLRSIQDWVVRDALQSVPGVAEVASVGGYVRQYQIDVDPNRLKVHRLTVGDIARAVRRSNQDIGAKTVERSGTELIVRGLGFIRGLSDIENTVVVTRDGVPTFVRQVADVRVGPDFRRGALADEKGERVGGVVTMRHGANPSEVIEGVKRALARLGSALPDGVRVVPFYDRTHLVQETTGTLRTALREELLVTVVVVFLFLFNVRASLIVAVVLPLAVLLCFLAMRGLELGANIMSLAGIAIAIGTMVDMGIVFVETAVSALRDEPDAPRRSVIARASAEVAPAVLTATLTTIVSFLPVFLLTGQAGRLFGPLAWTKTLALIAALVVSCCVVPAMATLFLAPQRASRADSLQGLIISAYRPLLAAILRHKARFFSVLTAVVAFGLLLFVGARALLSPFHAVAHIAGGDLERVQPFHALNETFPPMAQDFMPPLDEGSLLFMPSLLHQASLSEVLAAMIRMHERMRSVPEVSQVMGKLGRAETALDPAPVGMIETMVNLKPKDQWRVGVTKADILEELRRVTAMVGVSPSWLQPIETRVVMLQSGLKAPMALEISGTPQSIDGRALSDREAQDRIEEVSESIERVVAEVQGTEDVSALRSGGKPYLELKVDRERAARYDVRTQDLLDVLSVALGGKNLTWTLEGRARYPVRVQYSRELRSNPDELERLLVPTPSGAHVPLGRLVDITETVGPAAIRTRNAQLTGYVMFNAPDDEEAVMRRVTEAVDRWRADQRTETGIDPVPAGLSIRPAGRYLEKLAADERLMLIVPMVLFINLLVLYAAFRDAWLATAILLAIPVTFAGGFIGLWLYPIITGGDPIALTTAVWIGFIALFGIAVDDGAVMATYLRQTFQHRTIETVDDVRAAVLHAGSKRIRACLMTTATTVIALIPVLMSTGRGADVLKPMALPIVGGMVAELLSLFVVPAVYAWSRETALLSQRG